MMQNNLKIVDSDIFGSLGAILMSAKPEKIIPRHIEPETLEYSIVPSNNMKDEIISELSKKNGLEHVDTEYDLTYDFKLTLKRRVLNDS